MSDVPVAPAAPAAPAAPSEVVIDQNQASRPTPIGSQAPDKPAGEFDGSQHRPQSNAESRRDTIKKAFEKASQRPQQRPGMGHNNPPEPMAKEKPAPEKIDLKKRPSDQPRSEHGHFAARASEGSPEAGQQQPGVLQERRPAAQLPNHAPYNQPPSQQRWHPQARADWATTPESVRGEVHRMHREFGTYYERTRADQQTMNSIRQFDEMARQHGTTLQAALTNYVGIEQKLRADPIAGLDQIVNNLNLQTSDGHRITLRDIAYYYLNQTPEQHKLLAQSNAQTAQSHQMGQLYQTVNQLARQQQQLIQGIRFNQSRKAVDRFARDHPRLDELGMAIKRELDFGFDLPTAYKRAEMLYPATHAAQTRSPSAQTRQPDRSISGAPAGPTPNGPRRQRSATPREAVANALKRVNGSF